MFYLPAGHRAEIQILCLLFSLLSSKQFLLILAGYSLCLQLCGLLSLALQSFSGQRQFLFVFVTLNLQFSCFRCLSAGITGVYNHGWLTETLNYSASLLSLILIPESTSSFSQAHFSSFSPSPPKSTFRCPVSVQLVRPYD